MRTVIDSHREILLDVQGSNIWSGQQVQSYNSDAIAWGALGKPLYATGTRYGVWDFVVACYISDPVTKMPIIFLQFVPYMLLAGLGFPIIPWYLHKRYPTVGFNHVFTPILVGMYLHSR
jgi:hypothetical protein